MNKFFKVSAVFTCLVCLISFLVSCTKSDTYVEPPRDYQVQFDADSIALINYMKTHYMTVIQNPTGADHLNVTITVIPEGGTQTSIWNQTNYPVQSRTLYKHNITYTYWYVSLQQGTNNKPCNVDSVLTSYKGELLDGTVFDSNAYPQNFFNLRSTIVGWSEIMPQFKSGTYAAKPDGSISYSDFGAGVMFIPSGLAYFNGATTTIPQYSPLVFSFKLLEVYRNDDDFDKIPSYLEDIDGDGYVRVLDTGVVNPDDTDGDETPNYLDVDDDNDTFLTRTELLLPNTTNQYYTFDLIPTCSPSGKKRHLDASCH